MVRAASKPVWSITLTGILEKDGACHVFLVIWSFNQETPYEPGFSH